jgi:hypothetical protein
VQRAVSTIIAQDKLATECGFDGIVPRMWIGPVRSMTPDGRHFVPWDAVWMEEAQGISLDVLTFGTGVVKGQSRRRLIDRSVVADILFNKCAPVLSRAA